MRISENRYIRDLRRISLARRLIEWEVRTHLICDFTGLSDEAIRNLVRSYRGEQGGAIRHRGPPFRRLTALLASPGMHGEASALAGIGQVMGVIPREPLPPGRTWPLTLDCGEKLCHVFGTYRQAVPRGSVSMNHFIVLAQGLAEGRDVELGCCRECGGALLQERMLHTPAACPACRKGAPERIESEGEPEAEPGARDATGAGEGYQQPLF